MRLNIGNVMLLLSHFLVLLVSLAFSLPPSLMSVCWFMALFKWRPHVSPDAAICFSSASFFHSTPFEGSEELTKINPWLLRMQQSRFCGSSQGCSCIRELDRAARQLLGCSDKAPSRPGPLLLLSGVRRRCRKMTCHKDAINNAHTHVFLDVGKNGRRHKALLSA